MENFKMTIGPNIFHAPQMPEIRHETTLAGWRVRPLQILAFSIDVTGEVHAPRLIFTLGKS